MIVSRAIVQIVKIVALLGSDVMSLKHVAEM
jgi:hypothetical protein